MFFAGDVWEAQIDRERFLKDVMASVLVIEDHRDLANSLAEVLKLYGHEVRVAYDGDAGLAACDAELPDVVVLDISLPTIDGIQTAQQLRARYGASLRLIACSALDDGRTRLGMIRAGFDAILVKPAPVEKMLDAICGARVGRRNSNRRGNESSRATA